MQRLTFIEYINVCEFSYSVAVFHYFFQVIESEKAEFAFIHNAAHLRYEISKNCNLTEVGELFAEQPYAVAVQQGSYLQEEISRR